MKRIKELAEQIIDTCEDMELPELHEIEGSTIEWNRDRANINFTDREIMDTIEKLFFNGKSSQEILNHLEQL